MRRTAALTALLLVTPVSGCLQRVPEPEERAAATVQSFLASCMRESRERAAGLLTGLAREPFLAADSVDVACAETLGLGSSPAELPGLAFGDTTVERVELHGDVGAAWLRSGGGEESRVELEDVGGSWLLAGPG